MSVDVVEILIQATGWTYFFSWAICMYPQIIKLWKRKSIEGFSIDFVCYNVFGYVSYTISNGCYLWLPQVQRELNGEKNPVRINDFVFAVHGATMCLVMVGQILLYRKAGDRPSTTCLLILCSLVLLCVTLFVLTLALEKMTWILFLTCMGYAKFFGTLIKYVPQVLVNFRKKNTAGLSMTYVALDFGGSFFSTSQCGLLALQNGPQVLLKNLPKFCLGLEGILFSTTFMVQHCMFKAIASKGDYSHILPEESDSEGIMTKPIRDGGRRRSSAVELGHGDARSPRSSYALMGSDD